MLNILCSTVALYMDSYVLLSGVPICSKVLYMLWQMTPRALLVHCVPLGTGDAGQRFCHLPISTLLQGHRLVLASEPAPSRP